MFFKGMGSGMTVPVENRRWLSRCMTALLALVMAAPGAARCALGETLDSVEADGSVFHAVVRSQQRADYSVHTLSMPTGTEVNEYADTSGRVFAVTWQGAAPPDLSQLLGAYFLDYNAARPAVVRSGHRFLMVQAPRVVVMMAGHMRHLWGRAYLPTAMPAGVSLAEVR
jgi:hypothetical protein